MTKMLTEEQIERKTHKIRNCKIKECNQENINNGIASNNQMLMYLEDNKDESTVNQLSTL